MEARKQPDALQEIGEEEPPWYIRKWRLIWSLVGGLTLLVGLAVGVVQLVQFSQPEPLTRTQVLVFDTGDVEVGDDSYVDALCAGQSLSSARTDARLCTVANILMDPCFEIEEDRLVCPRTAGDRGFFVRAAETQRFYFETDEGAVFALDTAADQEHPWGLELRMPIAGEVQQAVCRVLLTTSERLQRPEYSCVPKGSPVDLALIAGEEFVDGTDRTVINVKLGPSVIGLDRSEDIWTVRVRTDTGWEEFPVEVAWY